MLKKIRNTKIDINLLPILSINFIGTLGFSIVIPFLAPLVSELGGNSVVYAIIASLYPTSQLIGAPILGNLSDKYGRKPTLLASQVGTLISWIIFFIALVVPITQITNIDNQIIGTFTITLPLIVISLARILDGLTGGNLAITQAYVADISTNENRNKKYGLLAISSNLGFIVGPALAGLLGATYLKEKLPTIAAITISLVATILIIRFLKETKPKEENQNEVNNDNKIKNRGKIYFILFIMLIINIAFNIFYATFPIHAVEVLGWDISRLGIYFAFLSFAMVVVQGPILNLLSKYIKEYLLVIIGNIVLIISFVLLTSDSNNVIYFTAILFALGNGIMWPNLLSILSKTADKSQQGRVQGLNTSITAIASISGLLIGGLIYVSIANNIFLISSTLFTLAALLSTSLLINNKHKT